MQDNQIIGHLLHRTWREIALGHVSTKRKVKEVTKENKDINDNDKTKKIVPRNEGENWATPAKIFRKGATVNKTIEI